MSEKKLKPSTGLAFGFFLFLSIALFAWQFGFNKNRDQEFLQAAGETETNTNYTLNVLAVYFNPVVDGKNLADTFYKAKMGGKTASQIEDTAFVNATSQISDATGGKVNYVIKDTLKITDLPVFTNGYQFTFNGYSQCVPGSNNFNATFCDKLKTKFDYTSFLNSHNICSLMESQNIDELWILSNSYIMNWSNFSFGPTNKTLGLEGPFSKNVKASYASSGCNKYHTSFNLTYDATGSALNVFSTRVTNQLDYLLKNLSVAQYKKYWNNFVRLDLTDKLLTTTTFGTIYFIPDPEFSKPRCGNLYLPGNSSSLYDFKSKTKQNFTCPDWNNIPDLLLEKDRGDCSLWGCKENGWYKYWLKSLPNSIGEFAVIGKNGNDAAMKKDWWYYISSPQNTFAFMDELVAPAGTTTLPASLEVEIPVSY